MFLGREISRSQDFSEDTARRIDAEVNRILREAYGRAKGILEQHRDKMDLIAKILLERETIDGRDVDEIAKHGRLLSEAERAEVDEKKAAETAGSVAVTEPPKGV